MNNSHVLIAGGFAEAYVPVDSLLESGIKKKRPDTPDGTGEVFVPRIQNQDAGDNKAQVQSTNTGSISGSANKPTSGTKTGAEQLGIRTGGQV